MDHAKIFAATAVCSPTTPSATHAEAAEEVGEVEDDDVEVEVVGAVGGAALLAPAALEPPEPAPSPVPPAALEPEEVRDGRPAL